MQGLVSKMDIAKTTSGLWENGCDSITHALHHFSERTDKRADWKHHNKWIILSVHHAAECFCKMRLLEIAANQWSERHGFHDVMKLLKAPQNAQHFSAAENQLLVLLNSLNSLRNNLMHRAAPEDLDVSTAAMCMTGLLKYAERHHGTTTADFLDQSPSIESDVVAAIRHTQHAEYREFVELFVKEKYPNSALFECPWCGACTVVNDVCEACYEDLDISECPQCTEPVYYLSWASNKYPEAKCKACDHLHYP